MTRRLAQSTAYTVTFPVFLSSDHVTPATGKTVAMTIRKPGGALGNPSGGATNATEVSNGFYDFTMSTTDANTFGDTVILGTATGCDVAMVVVQVVSATTNGATNLDAAISSVPTANANADALLDRAAGVETGLTFRQAMRLISGAVAAKLSGAGTATETVRNAVADSKDRMIVTVDASGNRSAITYDLT